MILDRIMSSVCDLGTIRNIIRGVDEHSPNTLFAEMIDNGEHSGSTKIFIDINPHEKKIVIGYENAVTEDQLNKMVTWNPSSKIHGTSNISTCGAGLKYYEFRFRGQQIHATKYWDDKDAKYMYMDTRINSDIIYRSATSNDVSETQFSDILLKHTSHVIRSEEVLKSFSDIFENEDSVYPFKPNTIILSKNITNDKLLEWLSSNENIKILEKELIHKYYEEIKSGKLTIFIKFPNDVFHELGNNFHTDIIGSTCKQHEHSTELYYVQNDFDKFKKGEYIIRINSIFFRIQPSGNSYIRTEFNVKDNDLTNILLQFKFTQYKLKDRNEEELKDLKQSIVGTSLEDYCGVYLKIGNKFIDGKPLPCNLTKRNLEGSRMYRGILELQNPEQTKMMLGIHGLKSEFNLSSMNLLEQIIKQCCIIYKNYCKCTCPVDPREYCIVRSSNKKSSRSNKPGYIYLRVIGKHFYKLGKTGSTNKADRIFDYTKKRDVYDQLKKDFPEEEIFPIGKFYYEFLSSEFNSTSSTEQFIIENLMSRQDVIMYDNKVGEEIREYFHCDNIVTIQEIKQLIMDALFNS